VITLPASSVMRRNVKRKRKKDSYALLWHFLNFAVKKKADSPILDY
jgi:hypothetical protein